MRTNLTQTSGKGETSEMRQAEVEAKVERKPDFFHLSLGLNLNLPLALAPEIVIDRFSWCMYKGPQSERETTAFPTGL